VIESLFKQKSILNVKKDYIVYKKGDKLKYIYFIKKGEIEVSHFIFIFTTFID